MPGRKPLVRQEGGLVFKHSPHKNSLTQTSTQTLLWRKQASHLHEKVQYLEDPYSKLQDSMEICLLVFTVIHSHVCGSLKSHPPQKYREVGQDTDQNLRQTKPTGSMSIPGHTEHFLTYPATHNSIFFPTTQ